MSMQVVPFEEKHLEEAVRIWLRYFRPVCYSAACHVNQQIGWAHSDRNMHTMW